MSDKVLMIDPALPLVWESNDTLRLGFDRAESRVHRPSIAAQRFIRALQKGVPQRDLSKLCRKLHISASERQTVLAQLASVLQSIDITPTAAPKTLKVAVFGGGPAAQALPRQLLAAGAKVVASTTKHDFAIVIERYLEPTQICYPLLLDSTPHLPVRFTDRSVWIGPIISPLGGPCLSCVELHDTACNPKAAVMAAQLTAAKAATETELCCSFAANQCSALIATWLQHDRKLLAKRYRFPVVDGVPALTPQISIVATQPDCGCVSLANSV